MLLAGCSVLGKREAAEPPFTVLEKEGEIEVRQYEGMVLAETVVESGYGQSSGQAFSRLAGYIFGKNRSKQKFSMTAPVLQEKQGNSWVMSFVMPEGSTLASLPEPLDPAVSFREVRQKKVAVISCSGLHSESNLRIYGEKLAAWLKMRGKRVLSAPRAASYDPPWTIPFLRRNEVQIDVD